MEKKTVERTSEARPATTNPSEGEPPSRQTNADIGAITKGSDGPAHTTKANQTTSTGSPRIPLSRDFLEKLGEMRDAEDQLTSALPKLRLAAKSEDLTKLLDIHLEETKGHLKSLEAILASSGEELPDKKCQPVRDMIKEAEVALVKTVVHDPSERDTTIIAAGRKVEQFEIGAYMPLCATANDNDWTHEFAVLTSILNQEKLADELLAGVAEGKEPLGKLIEEASLAHAKSGVS
jgi:ferritin-like metal-binding protein YciE